MVVSRSILLIRRNDSKLQKKSKHAFYIKLILSENLAVNEIIRKTVLEPDRPHMTIKFCI
jgi:hypothetical protein